MRIIPQSTSVSHTPFLQSPPLLMLPAPRIAGLLCAPMPETEAQQAHEQKQQRTVSDSFTYTDSRLTELSPAQRQQFLDAVGLLLNVALGYRIGEMTDDALQAAQVLFHRKLTGHSLNRRMNPLTYRAEADADIMDTLIVMRQTMAAFNNEPEVHFGAS